MNRRVWLVGGGCLLLGFAVGLLARSVLREAAVPAVGSDERPAPLYYRTPFWRRWRGDPPFRRWVKIDPDTLYTRADDGYWDYPPGTPGVKILSQRFATPSVGKGW